MFWCRRLTVPSKRHPSAPRYRRLLEPDLDDAGNPEPANPPSKSDPINSYQDTHGEN